MALYATTTHTTTDFVLNSTNCPYDCSYCTMTCYEFSRDNRTITICTFPDQPKREDNIFEDPADYKLTKFRRKRLFQRPYKRTIHLCKPLFKRKLLLSASGWLTRKEYRKKKGYNKKP